MMRAGQPRYLPQRYHVRLTQDTLWSRVTVLRTTGPRADKSCHGSVPDTVPISARNEVSHTTDTHTVQYTYVNTYVLYLTYDVQV